MALENVEYLLAGAALGLGSGISPGPLFTLVLTQTLAHGAREGVKVAVSPLLTDLPILAGAILAMAWIRGHPEAMGLMSLVGAVVIFKFGLECFKARSMATPAANVDPGSLKKGVLTNFLNPHVYLFWVTVGAPTTLRASETGLLAPALFLGGFYVCIVGIKASIACFTDRFRTFLGSRAYVFVMRLLGTALFVFAGMFARDGLRFLGLWD